MGTIFLFATLYYFFAESVDISDPQRPFIDCVYFSVVTITTLGYGDIAPQNWFGKLLTATEALAGIFIIGSYLNAISENRAKVAQENEKEQLAKQYKTQQLAKLRSNFKLLEPELKDFFRRAVRITKPLARHSEPFDENFVINDLRDLFGPGMILSDNFKISAIEYYFKSRDSLANTIKMILQDIDWQFWPEIQIEMLSFLDSFHQFDPRDNIISARQESAGDKTMTEFVKEWLSNHNGEPKFVQGNMFNNYVALYRQLKQQFPSCSKLAVLFDSALSD